MNLTKRLAAVAVCGTVVTGALTLGAGAAQAATLGGANLAPSSGTAQTIMEINTSNKFCPSGASGVTVTMTGAGMPTAANPDGNALQGFTDISLVTTSNGLKVSLGTKAEELFSTYGIAAPSGAYAVHLNCIGDDFVTNVGTYDVVANWTHAASDANYQGAYAVQVPAQSTSTVLTAPATATYGSPVTLSAAVTPSAASGTMQFKDNGANLGAPQAVNGSGVATFTTSTLDSGAHSLTAQFLPSTSAYTGSTSNAATLTVSKVVTSLALTSNGPTPQYSPATFTATVSPVSAGSVTFKEGATNLGTVTVDNTGHAAFTSSSLSVGTHSVSADFTPANPAGTAGSSAGPIDHAVTAFAGVTSSENLQVRVADGSLTIVIEDDAVVDMGTAALNASGDLFTATGALDTVKITDTRAGDPGWTASGVVSDFTDGTDAINGFNLGWAPKTVALAPHQTGFTVGGTVAPAAEVDASSTPADPAKGLGAARTLGKAGVGAGTGTARLGADLSLNIPTDVEAGLYTATLTFTVI